MARACGNPNCCASTGIHDSMTFGSGELDYYGFWEFPCAACAREFESLHPEYGECWPFEQKAHGEREESDDKRKETKISWVSVSVWVSVWV